MSEEVMQNFGVRMERDLAKKTRIVAIEDGFNSRSALIRELLRAYVDRRELEPLPRVETIYPTGVPVDAGG